VLPALVEKLPLREDFEENLSIFQCLNLLYQMGDATLKQQIPQIIRIAISVIYKKEHTKKGEGIRQPLVAQTAKLSVRNAGNVALWIHDSTGVSRAVVNCSKLVITIIGSLYIQSCICHVPLFIGKPSKAQKVRKARPKALHLSYAVVLNALHVKGLNIHQPSICWACYS